MVRARAIFPALALLAGPILGLCLALSSGACGAPKPNKGVITSPGHEPGGDEDRRQPCRRQGG